MQLDPGEIKTLETLTKHGLTTNYLVECISRVLIIAYKESTQELEELLTSQGFDIEVLRQEAKPEYQNFSRSYLCLMNHCRAWERAMQEAQPTIIIEADFVPVVDFGELPLPFNPNQNDVGISWLYTCAPQVYHVSSDGYAEGFSTSAVAYIVTPQSACYLLELAEEIRDKVGVTNYSTWDSTIDSFLRHKKLKNYIPWRNYGEHGGLPNPEHYQNKLSKTHRADVLYGKLAFTPLYAVGKNGGNLRLLSVRLWARVKGIARLLTGRFLRVKVLQGSNSPIRLLSFAVLRQLTLNL
ncbi:LPS biosynthesis glycosyltransferase [Nostoc sp. T09]|uniref:LPS biosynthesis glycosyltransferase n=1 Tax=Nostoc sp. T09 TaxID=1932621 RepID=UPI00211AC0EF|nr:LPS biosynthesis glycosyltransferase [Nostoc sp. T09]